MLQGGTRVPELGLPVSQLVDEDLRGPAAGGDRFGQPLDFALQAGDLVGLFPALRLRSFGRWRESGSSRLMNGSTA
jgi:hypothetical protein